MFLFEIMRISLQSDLLLITFVITYDTFAALTGHNIQVLFTVATWLLRLLCYYKSDIALWFVLISDINIVVSAYI